ncbi:hypothetical protein Lnau_2140 [Legionella nautarum]|uniref:Uncharacterized protein n=1 Tax=Legionella nautarum TaxID=45070 RepID=A0A0W0WNH6_9GAMM|nr:hypothetical protein [Legionella nautarum]KTD33848.1 hypothetical protein Lnau_2140 [Legionella nautarum]
MPKPEITFKISSKDTILKHVVISDLPHGLVQNTESSDACFKHFKLGVKDACYLHLEVNKREYDASAENNLSVCWNDNNDCISISKEQLNEAVENTDDFIHVEVSPMSIDGLQWDPTEFAIVGKPTKMEGDYLFQLKVIAHDGTTDSTTLPVYINDFSKNVFRFNDNINLPVATPGKEYKINLLELIGRSPPGKSSFQVHFKINRDPECPEWLKLEKKLP